MQLTRQIAEHLRTVHFGGNSTGVHLKEMLANETWEQATQQVKGFHSIATLVFHMNYYIAATLRVLQGGPLDAHDKYSFDVPAIESQNDWEGLVEKTWSDTEQLAQLIEQMPEEQLWEPFVKEKYGNYYRCLHGAIEHCHYHLGQIAILKSLLNQR